MNTPEFIASLVGSLAWPGAVVILVIILRAHLADLLAQQPSRLKAGPLQLEWDRTVIETAAELDAPHEAPLQEAAHEPYLDGLEELAERHPGAAVLEAAAQVERALVTLLDAAPGDVPPRRGMRDLARHAKERGLITDETARAIDGLSILRNLAAHGRDGITVEKAREFLALADGVIYQLRTQ